MEPQGYSPGYSKENDPHVRKEGTVSQKISQLQEMSHNTLDNARKLRERLQPITVDRPTKAAFDESGNLPNNDCLLVNSLETVLLTIRQTMATINDIHDGLQL